MKMRVSRFHYFLLLQVPFLWLTIIMIMYDIFVLILQQGTCSYDASKVVTKITSIVDIESGEELALQDAVANQGPVSVAIDASHSSFQFYSSGQ